VSIKNFTQISDVSMNFTTSKAKRDHNKFTARVLTKIAHYFLILKKNLEIIHQKYL